MAPQGTSTTNDMIAGDLTDPAHLPRLTRRLTGFLPQEIKAIDSTIPLQSRNLWHKHQVTKFENAEEFETRFINHVETTLARSLYNCDDFAAYEATSSSLKDNLVIDWNKTQQRLTTKDPKRVYYMSLEFLMGKALDNALINMKISFIPKNNGKNGDSIKARQMIKNSLQDLGFNLEDLLNQEPDAALGNGGLGRLAACFMDSMSTKDIPVWGYGLRYKYGIFAQKIIDGYQIETPDYWLTKGNPWEIARNEIQVPVTFYGYVDRKDGDTSTLNPSQWVGGERVLAVPFDFPVPGFNTTTVNNLRLWEARPTTEFDFAKFNSGDYRNSVKEQQRAEAITACLYPNDNFLQGKELRLKQQYFWCAATLHDIVRRFKKTQRPWSEFPDQVAIQLNDTHPTLAVVELQRILIDLEKIEWHEAWKIVNGTFSYTNHTVMQEALEKWPISLFGRMLPRHLEIIYDINWFFLNQVEKKFPKDVDFLSRISLIEESSPERQIRMAYLAIVGSHKVNGVAELHSELIKTTIFADFVKFYGASKFINVTNGITPRRWLRQCNPELSDLISGTLNEDVKEEYLLDLPRLTKLQDFVDDENFQRKWNQVKLNNKKRLGNFIKQQNNGEHIINMDHLNDTLIDVQVKRIHEYKRQQMNILGVIHRYLSMKNMFKQGASFEEVEKVYPRKVSVFGGKSAPGYFMAKLIIKLINAVAEVVNRDSEIQDLLKVVFISNYNVSAAEIIIPASDISEHISTAGTEASGTSNMKFVMNGGLIIGTVDGANIEITREIGEENIFLFGNLSENVQELRYDHQFHKTNISDNLQMVLHELVIGTFSEENTSEFKPIWDSIVQHGDYYLVSDDFDSYLATQELVDKTFHSNRTEWIKKSIYSVANVGFFSSDRCIEEYAGTIWNVEPLTPE
ncbi:hypothetical protein TBLA_0I03210 [Henningerozyma blattae CBS 6284]|uniref:Alpha-1,4 glucan phosphorylase n=1 Tax=Henningerozyma blattae (strain ATCC 34711 / CBS 6284 / DSM 70876 / NBRC 10599 / NRRL Y-10934 / UCD 77-7) TaxID=1071380 RepID=I2H9C4_HENB6|nr:hypothetical protein TBLA_0I03210 [Tetrapisispora blattae CBS 6284]CCH62976.1 hypothetical protein TBLA_0I03210 [Tetrapisispora blattae CBS 6284]